MIALLIKIIILKITVFNFLNFFLFFFTASVMSSLPSYCNPRWPEGSWLAEAVSGAAVHVVHVDLHVLKNEKKR